MMAANLTAAWIAAAVCILGALGVGAIALGLQEGSCGTWAAGAVLFSLSLLGIPLVR